MSYGVGYTLCIYKKCNNTLCNMPITAKNAPPLSGGVIFYPDKAEIILLFGKFYLNSAKSLLANALFCTCSRYIFILPIMARR